MTTTTSRRRRRGAPRGLAWALGLGAAALCLPRSARACGECGCATAPAMTSALELPGGARGAAAAPPVLRLALETRVGAHRARVHSFADEDSLEVRTTVGVAWSPWPAWTLLALAPVVYRRVAETNYATETAGLGDVDVVSRFRVAQGGDATAQHALDLSVGLGVPTGPAQLAASGAHLPAASQLGTGAWDPLAAAAYTGTFRAWSLYAAVALRWTTEGWGRWTVGRSVYASVAPGYQFAPWGSARLGLDVRVAEADRVGDAVLPNSGGVIAYATPTLLFAPSREVLVRFSAQVPVVNATRGQQTEWPSVVVGVTYAFGGAPPPTSLPGAGP